MSQARFAIVLLLFQLAASATPLVGDDCEVSGNDVFDNAAR